MPDTPTREIFWAISNRWVFYALSFVTLAVLLWGLLRSVRFIRRGTDSDLGPIKRLGVKAAAKDILTHKPLIGEDRSRWWHLLLFYGFLVLFLVTCYLMLAQYGCQALFTGTPYLIVSLAADLAGAGVILGVLLALLATRRDDSPARDRTLTKGLVLSLLGLVCVTGFLVEGARIRFEGDPWRAWSPVGALASAFLPASEGGPRLFRVLWWSHSVLALGLLAWIPLSPRLRHMMFLPFHRAEKPVQPRSPVPFVDLDAVRISNPHPGSVRLGIESGSDTTRGQRLGFLACMDCGRCERLCPAFGTGQPLTPRKYLQDLREFAWDWEKGRKARHDESGISAAHAISPSALWACRLCRACEELCPAGIEHVSQLTEIRRAEVLGHGRLPADAAAALRNVARTGNPYGSGPAERLAWIREQRIPDRPAEGSGKATLLWTGCFQPGDEQKPRVLSCLVSLLRSLEIPFFIPLEAGSCCGDPARVLGDEDLFQAVVGREIRNIEASGAEEVLVHCPHCYTVLKDVYPLLGARFAVVHTSEFFQDLLHRGRLGVLSLPRAGTVTYHDPCFLSRYQRIVEPPKEILRSLAGLELRELPRCGTESYCCGAGGGHFFMDLDLDERPSSQRLEEILAQGSDTLAVSCGFCFSMFDDALRRLREPPPLRIADWLELLWEARTG